MGKYLKVSHDVVLGWDYREQRSVHVHPNAAQFTITSFIAPACSLMSVAKMPVLPATELQSMVKFSARTPWVPSNFHQWGPDGHRPSRSEAEDPSRLTRCGGFQMSE